jgi:hypothetical protein
VLTLTPLPPRRTTTGQTDTSNIIYIDNYTQFVGIPSREEMGIGFGGKMLA